MLRWAVIFLVIGLVAGLLGFTGIAGTSVAIAYIPNCVPWTAATGAAGPLTSTWATACRPKR